MALIDPLELVLLDMVQTALDHFADHAQLAHHGRARAAQIVRRPGPAREQQGSGGLGAVGQRLIAHAVLDLLGDGFQTDMPLTVSGRQTPIRIAGQGLQCLELRLGKVGEIDGVILGILAVTGRNRPLAFFQVQIRPLGLRQLAHPAAGGEHDPDR